MADQQHPQHHHRRYRPSTGALHLLIDSTGVKAEGDGEWSAKKHGPSKPRDWRKVHLGIDAETLEIRAIEITGSRVGDAPMLPDLLNQIPDDQPLGIFTADGAYDTRACHAAIPARGAAAVSHVEAMKERIPVRITVRKQGGGKSVVEVGGEELSVSGMRPVPATP